MSKESSSSSSGGIGFFGLLGIVFIVLKLANVTQVATWSWVWVLAPLWGGAAFVLAVFCLLALFALIIAAVAK